MASRPKKARGCGLFVVYPCELEDVALSGYKRLRIKDKEEHSLSDGEQDLIENYRRLSKKYQDRVREHVRVYLVVEGKEALSSRRAVKKLRRP